MFLIQQALAVRYFILKQLIVEKWLQHKYYGSAFTVAEHMYLSKYVPCMYNYSVVCVDTLGFAA